MPGIPSDWRSFECGWAKSLSAVCQGPAAAGQRRGPRLACWISRRLAGRRCCRATNKRRWTACEGRTGFGWGKRPRFAMMAPHSQKRGWGRCRSKAARSLGCLRPEPFPLSASTEACSGPSGGSAQSSPWGGSASASRSRPRKGTAGEQGMGLRVRASRPVQPRWG